MQDNLDQDYNELLKVDEDVKAQDRRVTKYIGICILLLCIGFVLSACDRPAIFQDYIITKQFT